MKRRDLWYSVLIVIASMLVAGNAAKAERILDLNGQWRAVFRPLFSPNTFERIMEITDSEVFLYDWDGDGTLDLQGTTQRRTVEISWSGSARAISIKGRARVFGSMISGTFSDLSMTPKMPTWIIGFWRATRQPRGRGTLRQNL